MIRHYIVTPEGSLPIDTHKCHGVYMMIDRKSIAERINKLVPSRDVDFNADPVPVKQLTCQRIYHGPSEIHILVDPRCFDA